jgi:hypothetical protein
VPRSLHKVKCKAATLDGNSAACAQAFFSRPWMPFKIRLQKESEMRTIRAASLVVTCAMLALSPARADTVPPFKGNDTGGIIAYSLTHETDTRALAIDHCARRWEPYDSLDRPVRARY